MTSPICDILTLLSLLVIICLLRRTIEIFPSLLASLIRWKESINLFNSVKLSIVLLGIAKDRFTCVIRIHFFYVFQDITTL